MQGGRLKRSQLKGSQLQDTEISRAFSAAAYQYDQFTQVQRNVGAQLLQVLQMLRQLQTVQQTATRILDAGCGTGVLTERLYTLYDPSQLLAVDLASDMLAVAANRLKAYDNIDFQLVDLMQPLASLGCFDLIYSNFTLHWCGQPKHWLQQLSAVLSNYGCLAIALPVSGSLDRLKQAWAMIDDEVHINQFPNEHLLMAAIEGIGLQLLYSNVIEVKDHYSSVHSLLRALKGMGAHHVQRLPGQDHDELRRRGVRNGLRGRRLLQQLEENFVRLNPERDLCLDYRIWLGVLSK